MSIVVVDNASAGDEVERLRALLPADVEIVELATNRGYGAACNAAIRLARERSIPYVWLLNNDIAIEQDCHRKLLDTLETMPDTGAAAPTVVEFDRPDFILSCGMDVSMWRGSSRHRRWGESARLVPPGAELVDALEASALMVRTATAVECGGFDEAFFMYSEDLEWSLRVRAHGWNLASIGDARILHRVSQSSASLARLEYMIRGRIRAVRVCGSLLDQLTFVPYMVLGWLPAYGVFRMLRKHGLRASARTLARAVLWNVEDAARRRRWRLAPADQEVPVFSAEPQT